MCLIAFCVSFGFLLAQDTPSKNPVRDPLLLFAVSSLEKSLTFLNETYRRELEMAKQAAIRNADPDEVQLINDALAGKPVSAFTSLPARQARLKFEKGLVELSSQFQKSATDGVVELLRRERIAEAKELKKLIAYIEYNTLALSETAADPVAGGSKAYVPKMDKVERVFRLEADKDWQNTEVQLPPGMNVEVLADGRWAPGNSKDDEKYKLSDADTFNFELKVQGVATVSTGGTKWTMRSADGGALMGRMKDYNPAGRSKAKGGITVTVRWEELKKEEAKPTSGNKLLEPLEYILARNFPDGGKKLFGRDLNLPAASNATVDASAKPAAAAAGNAAGTAPAATGATAGKDGTTAGKDATASGQAKLYKKFYRLKVLADRDWQLYPIDIKTGDKISFSASGSWTPESDKQVPANADTFGYVYKIGTADEVKAGAKCDFTAPASGKLMLRIASREWITSNKAKPSGELEITVTMEREGEEIK